MPTFTYTAKLANGENVAGLLEAPSQQMVLEALHRQDLVVVRIREMKAPSLWGRKIRMDDLAVFARQMATLIDAGIPIVGGLEAVADQLEHKLLKKVVTKVRESVVRGMNLTTAIARQSAFFPQFFISMIKSGEASGHLAEVLNRLAIYLEKTASIQRKIKAATVYPTIVITLSLLITAALVLKVIPAFKEIFTQLGAELPLPTRILLAVSDAAQKYLLVIVGLVVVCIFLFRRFIKTPFGRLLFDRFLLKLPVFGLLVRKVAIARFARTLSTLVKSGVQILAALEIVSETAGNKVVGNAVLQVRSSIREGENIAGPLMISGVFPPLVVRMIAVGEQTGRLDEMLTKIADFYEEQVDAAVSGLTSAIEPLIIVVLGFIIGSIVLSIFLPIFKMTQVMTR